MKITTVFAARVLVGLVSLVFAAGAVPIDCYLEYLGGNEAPIVDTGYVFTKKPRVEARAKVTGTNDRWIFGTAAAEASNLFAAKYWGKNNYLSYRYGSAGYVMSKTGVGGFVNNWIDYVWSDIVTHDGIAKGVQAPAGDFSGNTEPFWLFGCGAGKGAIQFQYVKMYDDGILVRDLHPAKSNGVAGMYDLLNDVFYANSGTGSFQVGSTFSAVGSRGTLGSFGTPTPAYGVLANDAAQIQFSLAGSTTFGDAVTAYPSEDGLERATFQQLSLSCDGGTPVVSSNPSYVLDVPSGTKAVSAEWAFANRQVCLRLVQSGAGSADFYLDGVQVTAGDYWLEDGANVTVRIVPTAGSKYLGCKGSDSRAKTSEQEFSATLAGQGLAVTARVESASYVGPIRTWKGGTKSGDYYCSSIAANWTDGILPENGDVVSFDSTSTSDCLWDLTIVPGGWSQTADYTGTVTFRTTYAAGDSAFFNVSGDVNVQGGTWKHCANSGLNRTYRLYAKVGGDMTIGSAAKVSAIGCGYTQQYMAKGGAFSGTNIYPTHGGFGYEATATWPLGGNGAVPYGVVQAPEEPGSGWGASYPGGGAIRLDVTGKLTVNGTIDADAGRSKNYTGAGGSVYLRVGTIAGTGSVTANSLTTSTSSGSGSGGRIAIILTSSGADFDDFDPQTLCSAYSGTLLSGNAFGQPGTIYAETPADTPNEGWLIIKSAASASKNAYCNMTPLAAYGMDKTKYARITVNGAGASACVPDYANIDMSAMTAGTFPSAIRLAGGTWKPPANGVVDYAITSYDGLRGVDCARLDFVAGSSLTVAAMSESHPYDGDMSVAAGVTFELSSPLKLTGDLAVTGTISRTEPKNVYVMKAIEVEVGGDLTVGAAGSISAKALGYAPLTCPSAQTYSGASASHAGWGWATTATDSGPSGTEPYGSVKEPLTFGAGGSSYRGGGILRLVVGGTLTNDGLLTAEASEEKGYYTGAGGSANIRAAALKGNGIVSAAAWQSHTGVYAHSSGGRVAIRLTGSGADFSDYTGTICANGTHNRSPSAGNRTGSAGTVWLKTAADGESEGRLIVDNGFAGLAYYRATLLGGTYMAADELAYGDVVVGRSCRLQLAENQALTVSGVFSNGCEFASTAGSSVVFAGTDASTVYGDTTFCNLGSQTPGKEIRFAAGSTTTATGSVDFTGSAAAPIVLKSAVDGEKWTLDAAAVTMNGVALKDCISEQAITILNGTDLGGNSDNITFQSTQVGELLTWTGAEGTAWSSGANWDKGRAPIATDLIAIPAGCPNMPALMTDVTVAELAVSNGATLALASRSLTVNGNLLVAGSLEASGTEVVTVASNLTLVGFVPAQSTVRLAGTFPRTFSVGADATFWNLDLGIGEVTVHGDVTANAFTAGNGTAAIDVLFDDGATVEATAFTVSADATGAGGSLAAAGATGVWNLIANESDVTGVTVTGSDASEGVTIVPQDCTDGGRNVNWLFVDNRTHWTGAVSSDFADPDNWSDGVPTAEKDAVIEGSVVCAVTAAGTVSNLTVAASAKIRVDASAFAVAGNLTVEPTGTVEWNAPGTVAGKLTLLRNAVLTHAANDSSGTAQIDLVVAGTGYIAAGAKVDAFGKRTAGGVKGASNSYGGRLGIRGSKVETNAFCFGSVLQPVHQGNFRTGNAGGAVKLTFAGALKLDGEIDADAAASPNNYSSSGGSVWLTAAALTGSGTIHANGGIQSGIDAGGGGRIALYLTAANALELTGVVRAVGGRTSSDYTKGSCGTVYLETAADAPGCGTVTIANVEGRTDGDYTSSYATDYPVVHENDNPDEAKKATFVVKHYGSLYLTRDATIADIHLLDSTAKLRLNGHTLRIKSLPHAISPDDATQIIPGDGGKIVWNQKGFSVIVR